MSSANVLPNRRAAAVRLLSFAIETHPPAVYVLVSWGWAASLMAMLAAGRPLPSGAAVVGAVFFLILLYLRAVDEVKDLPYDRVHHPERPVVRGAVSVRDVSGFAVLVAIAVIGLSAWLAAPLALFAAIQLGYALVLLSLERRSRRFRETLLLNLAVTFPVSAALNVFVVLWFVLRGVTPADAWPAVLAHVAVFLHMEFGRKLSWPHLTAPGDNGYARVLGARGAAAVCAAFGLSACGLASWVHLRHGAGPWAALPWLALVLSSVGLLRFLRDRRLGAGMAPCAMKPWFGGAMILFFALNAVVGLA